MNKKSNESHVVVKLASRPTTLDGFATLEGNDVTKITYDEKVGHLPRLLFVQQTGEARMLLAKQGVIITSNADWRAIVSGVDDLRAFVSSPLIERPGWTGVYFARTDGRVFAPSGKPKAHPIFPASGTRAHKGTITAWLKEVAQPLTGQNLPIIAVLAALASPVLRYAGIPQNFGFEFGGPPGTGKTTCVRLMRSVAADPANLPTFNSTKAGREAMFAEHNDMPFAIDEASFVDSSEGAVFLDFAFGMAGGTAKVTAFQPDRSQHRFIVGTTSNQPYHTHLRRVNSDKKAAALERLLPMMADGVDSLGVFDFVPDGFTSSGQFAAYLHEVTGRIYGVAINRMLRKVVIAVDADEDAFRRNIRARIEAFEREIGMSETASGGSRASAAFGLLYAAGSFAKARKILPHDWDCLGACVAGYRNYQAQVPSLTPLPTRLLTLATLPTTLDLRDVDRPRMSDAKVARHGAFLVLGKGKRVELLLTDTCRDAHFGDFADLLQHAQHQRLIICEDDRWTTHRQIRTNKKRERMTCFVLPAGVVARL